MKRKDKDPSRAHEKERDTIGEKSVENMKTMMGGELYERKKHPSPTLAISLFFFSVQML